MSIALLPGSRSHGGHVYRVVLRVRTYETDIHDAVWIIALHHEAVFVPANVETHPVMLKNARIAIVDFDRCWAGPIGRTGDLEPGFQGLLRVPVLRPLPECSQRFLGDDSHGFKISCYQCGIKKKLAGSKAGAHAGSEGYQCISSACIVVPLCLVTTCAEGRAHRGRPSPI